MSEEMGALIDEGQREFEAGLESVRAATVGMTRHNAYLGVLKGLIDEPEMDRIQVCSIAAFASLLLIEERAKGGPS